MDIGRLHQLEKNKPCHVAQVKLEKDILDNAGITEYGLNRTLTVELNAIQKDNGIELSYLDNQ
jgi:hypothetical protein